MTSFLDPVLGQLSSLAPDLTTGLLLAVIAARAVKRARNCGATVILPQMRLVSDTRSARWQRPGLRRSSGTSCPPSTPGPQREFSATIASVQSSPTMSPARWPVFRQALRARRKTILLFWQRLEPPDGRRRNRRTTGTPCFTASRQQTPATRQLQQPVSRRTLSPAQGSSVTTSSSGSRHRSAPRRGRAGATGRPVGRGDVRKRSGRSRARGRIRASPAAPHRPR